VELWPIDMGYDHFTVNNLSYHGRNVTIVWDKPGDGVRSYQNAPEGYSLYVNGNRAFTVDDLAHVSWNGRTGVVSIRDGSSTRVLFSTRVNLDNATNVRLRDNERLVDVFQKAGVELSPFTGTAAAVNLAEGKSVSASFTTTSPSLQATAPENAVDGFTISGLPIQSGSYIVRNPIWGTRGSPNAQDWYQIDLGSPTRFNTVKLYFYSDKNFGSGGNTYRQPTSYSVQYQDGSTWVDVPRQVKTPGAPQPNYNKVTFAPLTARLLRVLLTPTSGYGIGLKEVQVFNAPRPVAGP
jgi:F5/8 type C domain-containing protein